MLKTEQAIVIKNLEHQVVPTSTNLFPIQKVVNEDKVSFWNILKSSNYGDNLMKRGETSGCSNHNYYNLDNDF